VFLLAVKGPGIPRRSAVGLFPQVVAAAMLDMVLRRFIAVADGLLHMPMRDLCLVRRVC
jgi:hypothetical protein